MKFKQGSEYTVRRIIALLILVFLVFAVLKLITRNFIGTNKTEKNNNPDDQADTTCCCGI